MSLIFSALSEMEKQAQDGQPVRAPLSGMQSYVPERKQWPILIGTLGALGLATYIAVKLLAPATPASAPVAVVPPLASVATPPATVVGPVPSAPANTTPELAPYAQAQQPVMLPDSASQTMMLTSNASLPAASMAAAPVPVYGSMQTSVPSANNAAPADVPAGSNQADAPVAASQNETAMTVEPEPVQQAAPMPRTPPDKSYLDKSTFKLGRQPDSSKDQDVSHWVNLFSSEMSAGNFEQAREYLAKLQAKLPAQSITLLRMQAWYSVDTSDDNAAREIFLRILDRVPDDQNAGVNIALIDWRANRFSAALARIDRLHQMYPDSSLVSQNWRSMHDQQQ